MYEIKKTITIDRRKYSAGEIVDVDVIPGGTLESCLRRGWVVKHEPPKKPKEPKPEQPADPVENLDPVPADIPKPKRPRKPKK